VLATSQARDFFLVDFGNGVGSVAVVGGRVYRGNLPMIGEIGHTPVRGNARPCGCGARGCLETLVSRDAIAEAVLYGSRRGGPRAGRWAKVVEAIDADASTAHSAPRLMPPAREIASALGVLGIDRVRRHWQCCRASGARDRTFSELGPALRVLVQGRAGRGRSPAEAQDGGDEFTRSWNG
jgi:hypothetical protein